MKKSVKKSKGNSKEVEATVTPYKPKLGFKNRIKMVFRYPARMFLIMYRENDTIDARVVFHNNHAFVYNNGLYIIDRDFMKWSDSLQMMVSTYFEGISIPVNMNIDEETLIEKAQDELKTHAVEKNLNPNILKRTVESEVIQKLQRGSEIEKVLSTIKLMSILCLCGIGFILMAFFMFMR